MTYQHDLNEVIQLVEYVTLNDFNYHLQNVQLLLNWYKYTSSTCISLHGKFYGDTSFIDFKPPQNVQLLLNWMCNAKIRPPDTTCCVPMDWPNSLQILTFCFFLLWYVYVCVWNELVLIISNEYLHTFTSYPGRWYDCLNKWFLFFNTWSVNMVNQFDALFCFSLF